MSGKYFRNTISVVRVSESVVSSTSSGTITSNVVIVIVVIVEIVLVARTSTSS